MAEGVEAAARASKPLPADSAEALAAGLLFRNEPLVEFFAAREGGVQHVVERRETMMPIAMASRSSMSVMAEAVPVPPGATLPEDDEDGSSTTSSGSGGGSSSASSGSAADSSADRSSSSTSAGKGRDDAPIPLAFRGGAHEEGVGDVLGHALAALYVARHGLTVTELTHLLATLREREDRRFWARVWERQGALSAAFSEADRTGDGELSLPAFESILQQHGLDAKPHDLARLLIAAGARAPEDNAPVVLYHALLEHCGTEQQRQQQQASGGEAAGRSSIPPLPFPKSVQSSASRVAHDTPREPRRAVRHPLGEEMETALLQMLVALGVLLVHDGNVLVLPLEAETLREAIRARYIDAGGAEAVVGPSGGGEELWHKAIIHYFQSQPSGLLRRCEELPWHLQVCRHWVALRDFLVDLRAFRAMYGGRLKHELFEYWRLLTEGPLVLPGILAAAAEGGGLLDNGPALAVSRMNMNRIQCRYVDLNHPNHTTTRRWSQEGGRPPQQSCSPARRCPALPRHRGGEGGWPPSTSSSATTRRWRSGEVSLRLTTSHVNDVYPLVLNPLHSCTYRGPGEAVHQADGGDAVAHRQVPDRVRGRGQVPRDPPALPPQAPAPGAH